MTGPLCWCWLLARSGCLPFGAICDKLAHRRVKKRRRESPKASPPPLHSKPLSESGGLPGLHPYEPPEADKTLWGITPRGKRGREQRYDHA